MKRLIGFVVALMLAFSFVPANATPPVQEKSVSWVAFSFLSRHPSYLKTTLKYKCKPGSEVFSLEVGSPQTTRSHCPKGNKLRIKIPRITAWSVECSNGKWTVEYWESGWQKFKIPEYIGIDPNDNKGLYGCRVYAQDVIIARR